ncbi:BnaA02g30920D [Brassica napus]|uniref:BnaA02g30920D protein n=1 Tax=Brassica napus TaxID=3708 RepID=A0A078H5P6_BRANA|nr:BnaA02g30920D [Brassica napus]
MGKTRSMGSGRCTPIGLPRPRRSLFRPLSVGERGLQRKSKEMLKV